MCYLRKVLLWAFLAYMSGVLSTPIPSSGARTKMPSENLNKIAMRIVNGMPVTDKNEYPFVVDLSHHDTAISTTRFCTGTLIQANVLLTAAHCVLNEGHSAPVYATIGRIELDDLHHENRKAQTFRTVASIAHPTYNGVGSANDVALMLLNGSSTAPTVRLAESTPDEDEEAWVVGYGIQMQGTVEEIGRPISVMSGRLQKTALRIKARSFCDAPGGILQTQEGMICTAGVTKGSSACNGDSGGGLFSLRRPSQKGVKNSASDSNEIKREAVQVGIVSYGDAQCMSEDSGVFTDVASVRSWIEESSLRLQEAQRA